MKRTAPTLHAAPDFPDLLPLALRNTAMTVAGFADGQTPTTFDALRAECDKQIQSLRAELESQGHPPGVIDDGIYAQCALLDEAALSHLTDEQRVRWELAPLQVKVFSTHDAGEELIRRIERRLEEPVPVMPLLAIFAAVLGLGFNGRFARDGHDARGALMRAIDQRLDAVQAADLDGTVIVNPRGEPTRVARFLRSGSPLGWVMVACVATGLAWLAADQWLTASIEQIARPMPPSATTH